MASQAPTGGETCRVLDIDPDLARGINQAERELARSGCLGKLCHLDSGPWDLSDPVGEQHLLGFVIVSGLVFREVALRDRHMVEFLGAGDVVQRPVTVERPRLGSPVKCTVAADATVMALGETFIRAAARWPGLLVAVHERLEAQRESLAIQGVIAHLARAEHRVLLQLWHLADRWGRVTTEGTLIPLALTHELLGHLIAARRPTVTLALAELESQGLIRRVDGSEWLLTPDAEQAVFAIAGDGDQGQALGDSFRFRHRAAVVSEESRLRAVRTAVAEMTGTAL